MIAFDCDRLFEFLENRLRGEVGRDSLETLRCNKVSGKVFLQLTEEDLKDFDITLLGERKLILSVIQSYKEHPKVVSN